MSSLSKKQKGLVFGGSAAVLGVAAVAVALLMQSPAAPVIGENPTATAHMGQADVSISTPAPDVEKQRQEELALITSRLTMLKGTRIHGVDVSNMTKEQAKQAVESTLEASGAEVKLTLLQENGVMPSAAPADEADAPADTGDGEEEEAPILYTKTDKGVVYTPTARNLILTADVDKAVQEAFDLARDSQDYEGTMALVNNIAQNGKDIALSYTASSESVQAYVEDISFLIDKPAVNKAYNVDPNTHKLSVTECEDGYGIDREALEKSILELDPTREAELVIPMQVLQGSDAAQEYVLRGEYKTSFKGSSSNRKYNIKKGSELINGTILKPGEVFSTNAKLGQRTTKNGWKLAPAYVSGAHEDQPGGGVCQLSSTLFNAVTYADLEVVDRRNHSMPVSYVSKGRDATINSVGNIIDFKFKNSTEGDIIIVSYVSGNDLYFDIYGLPKSDEFDTIEIETKQISSQGITTEYTEDPSKGTDYEEVLSKGSKGYKYKTYVYYYKNGQLLEDRTIVYDSVYKMFPKQVVVGTKTGEGGKSDPTPTPKGEDTPTVTPDPGAEIPATPEG